jgi:hypothetical protein
MSSTLISEPYHLTFDKIYSAILAKERDYATQLYAQLKGITLTSAEQAMSVIYRVFHLGYEDCLHHVSIDDMPGFENNVHIDVWRAGFGYALKLPTSKVISESRYKITLE